MFFFARQKIVASTNSNTWACTSLSRMLLSWHYNSKFLQLCNIFKVLLMNFCAARMFLKMQQQHCQHMLEWVARCLWCIEHLPLEPTKPEWLAGGSCSAGNIINMTLSNCTKDEQPTNLIVEKLLYFSFVLYFPCAFLFFYDRAKKMQHNMQCTLKSFQK